MNATTHSLDYTHSRTRRLSVLTVAAAAFLAGVSITSANDASAATSKKAKTAKATKKSVVAKAPAVPKAAATPKAPAVPKRAFDINRCTYLDTDAVSSIVGSSLSLDTSPGDAGSNTHAYSEKFEQCVYNLSTEDAKRHRMQVIVHVQRNGKQIHDELLSGQWNSPCPAACVTVPGLGDSAVVSAKFGDGGGFTTGAWGHLHVMKGSTRVYVAIAPSDTSVNNDREWDHANRIDPAQVDRATKIAQIVLPQI